MQPPTSNAPQRPLQDIDPGKVVVEGKEVVAAGDEEGVVAGDVVVLRLVVDGGPEIEQVRAFYKVARILLFCLVMVNIRD